MNTIVTFRAVRCSAVIEVGAAKHGLLSTRRCYQELDQPVFLLPLTFTTAPQAAHGSPQAQRTPEGEGEAEGEGQEKTRSSLKLV